MPDMLRAWSDSVARHGSWDVAERMEPDVYEECAIDEPVIEKGEVTWCPMYWKDKK